jgi:hypothetical protein
MPPLLPERWIEICDTRGRRDGVATPSEGSDFFAIDGTSTSSGHGWPQCTRTQDVLERASGRCEKAEQQEWHKEVPRGASSRE